MATIGSCALFNNVASLGKGFGRLLCLYEYGSHRYWQATHGGAPTYRSYHPVSRGPYSFVNVTFHSEYYLGPDKDKDEDRHHVVAEPATSTEGVNHIHCPEVLIKPNVLFW
jgi:hypothetical protein